MKRFVIVPLLLLVGLAASTTTDYVAEFAKFKVTYRKAYSTPEEESHRFKVFVDNMKRAEEQQRKNPLARYGATEFSDMTAAEFSVKRGDPASARAAVRRAAGRKHLTLDAANNNVTKIDWRKKGAVTPIKNQMTCGGCWAFSTTGNIEGQWAIAGYGLETLSEQELVSCVTTCNGCHGGNQDLAFEWIINTRGGAITSEAQYPYVSGEAVVPACATKGKTAAAYISSFVDIAHDEATMAKFVADKGPLSILVDATSFESYQGGIVTNGVSNQIDHAVLIVGYDFTGATPYWIIKNQWGTTWGEEGYIYLAYGSNQCLLTTLPSSAVVSNPPPLPPAGTPAPPSPPDVTQGTFTQMECSSSTCTSNCTNTTLPNGKCLKLSNGMSAITSCGQQSLRVEQYNTSDCTGPWTQGMIQLNQCNALPNGMYQTDECTASNGSGSGSGNSPATIAPASGSASDSSNFEGAASFMTEEAARGVLHQLRAHAGAFILH